MTAGKPASPEQVAKWMAGYEKLQLSARCLGFFDNASLEQLGYVHNYQAPGGYGESKGLWVRAGLVKDRISPIISAVKSGDNITPEDIIGSHQDSKWPGSG